MPWSDLHLNGFLKIFGGSIKEGFERDMIRGRKIKVRERQENMPPMFHVDGKGDK